MLKTLDTNIDAIFILDLLSEDERKQHQVTENLVENLTTLEVAHTVKKCTNKNDVFDAFKSAIIDAKEKQLLLHIVSHGNKSCFGLKHTSELIKWIEIKDYLTELNKASKGNLLINFTSCQGAHSIKLTIICDKEHPFFGIIGSKDKISFVDAKTINKKFYEKMAAGLDIPKIGQDINREMNKEIIDCISSEGVKKILGIADTLGV